MTPADTAFPLLVLGMTLMLMWFSWPSATLRRDIAKNKITRPVVRAASLNPAPSQHDRYILALCTIQAVLNDLGLDKSGCPRPRSDEAYAAAVRDEHPDLSQEEFRIHAVPISDGMSRHERLELQANAMDTMVSSLRSAGASDRAIRKARAILEMQI